MSKELVLFANGVHVRTDKDGNICLTDLFKASGKDRTYDPSQWISQDSTKGLIEVAATFLNTASNCIIKSKRGKGGGTFAHRNLALAYAKYLSPELHIAVNEVFFERLAEEKNPELAVNRAVKSWQKQGKSEEWTSERLSSIASRNGLTSTLAKHEVKGIGFRDCTNAIYTPLFGGGADTVRSKKNLPEKANTREHMSEIELATVRLIELTAADNIQKKGLKGNKPCEYECLTTSRIFAKVLIENRNHIQETKAA